MVVDGVEAAYEGTIGRMAVDGVEAAYEGTIGRMAVDGVEASLRGNDRKNGGGRGRGKPTRER